MKRRFTRRAAAELDLVLDYIDARSPNGAENVKRRIQSILETLLAHPGLGRKTSAGHLRRIVAHPYPYLIFYRVTSAEIIVHGVRHGARSPSSMPEGG